MRTTAKDRVTNLKLNLSFFVVAIVGWSALAADRPFWTEKSSYAEGDKVFFVGVASNVASIEDGRKAAATNSKAEISNYAQLTDLTGLTINTQMTFEEKLPDGRFNVYRLMFVNADQIADLKKKNLDKQLQATKLQDEILDNHIKKNEKIVARLRAKENKANEQQSEIDRIKSKIEEEGQGLKQITCGMTLPEVKKIIGPPRGAGDCLDTKYYGYGKYWLVLVGGIVRCVARDISSPCRDNCLMQYSRPVCPDKLSID